ARGAHRRRHQVPAAQDAALLLRRDHVVLERAAAVGDIPRLRVLRHRLPRHPADRDRPLHAHVRARRAVDDPDHPAARRHPADHRGDHRRVRRPHLRRGQAPAAVRGARADQRRGAGLRIAVLGAGVAGLVAAYRLTQAGHAVDVYERWPGLGGQAATLDVGEGHLLERYYHHLFSTDRHITALYDELGLQNELRLRRGDDAAEEKLGYPRRSWEPLFGALRERIEAGGGRVLIDRPAARLAPGFVVTPGAPGSFRSGHDPRAFATEAPERY